MGKTMAFFFFFIFFFLCLQTSHSYNLKPNPVKCHDSKNFPTCFKNNNLHCPTQCPFSCIVDCAKCRPVCIPPPKSLHRPNKPAADCNDKNQNKNNSPRSPPIKFPPISTFKAYNSSPPKVNYPPHGSFKGGYPKPTPYNKPKIVFPPHASFKGRYPSRPPPPKKEPIGSPPNLTTSKASSTPPRVSTTRCKNKSYPKCYFTQHKCPPACPDHCEVDCAKCSPVCSCNYPGAVCKDPRFVGGDGLTFYFHGKKNQDFCILSDRNLHINAHFIGIRNLNMTRDFTWIQSIGIRFGSHNLSIAALPTSTWDDASDRLSISFDGRHQSSDQESTPNPNIVEFTRWGNNAVVVEANGLFQIKANVVPITERESRVHGYGIDTEKDCFAHLDLSFKFYSLSEKVDGVLGQTYASNYVSRVKMGVEMPVLGGNDKFLSSTIFATDCAASIFKT